MIRVFLVASIVTGLNRATAGAQTPASERSPYCMDRTSPRSTGTRPARRNWDATENSKFARIMDPDGNKVELWEPKLWDDKNKGA